MFEQPDVLASIGCGVLILLALATIYFVAREKPGSDNGDSASDYH